MKHETLQRELGLSGSILMGLGAMIGTGVFVGIGIAAGVAGALVIPATLLAALVATCNALSSASLAARHPVSGGTYEYGYLRLAPLWGFAAGWMFLCAKSASAATAALGFAGYLAYAAGWSSTVVVTIGIMAVVVLTIVVLAGMRRSNVTNAAIVTVTLGSLALFVAAGVLSHPNGITTALTVWSGSWPAFFEAAALMFVAFTGYGRIATLGEEVRDPERTIPRAIISTVIIVTVLYLAVATVGIVSLGAEGLAGATSGKAAPLEIAARSFRWPGVSAIVAAGAITAMLGVLLNLLLGLSRVVLAMARRGDLPAALSRLNEAKTTPMWAVLLVGAAIAALTTIGSVKTTWSFSAFTVLLYYAITNLAALKLAREERLVHPIIPILGLAGCLGLAFMVEPMVWITGTLVLVAGIILRNVWRRIAG